MRSWWIFSCAASSTLQVWWLGVGRGRVFLRGPRCEALFSERHCTLVRIPLWGGWRVTARMVAR